MPTPDQAIAQVVKVLRLARAAGTEHVAHAALLALANVQDRDAVGQHSRRPRQNHQTISTAFVDAGYAGQRASVPRGGVMAPGEVMSAGQPRPAEGDLYRSRSPLQDRRRAPVRGGSACAQGSSSKWTCSPSPQVCSQATTEVLVALPCSRGVGGTAS